MDINFIVLITKSVAPLIVSSEKKHKRPIYDGLMHVPMHEPLLQSSSKNVIKTNLWFSNEFFFRRPNFTTQLCNCFIFRIQSFSHSFLIENNRSLTFGSIYEQQWLVNIYITTIVKFMIVWVFYLAIWYSTKFHLIDNSVRQTFIFKLPLCIEIQIVAVYCYSNERHFHYYLTNW